MANRLPDRPGWNRQCACTHETQRADEASRRPSVWDGDDKPHRPVEAPGQCLTLQLSRAELGLKINERALDLDVDDLARSFEDKVRCAHIPRANRKFQPRMP